MIIKKYVENENIRLIAAAFLLTFFSSFGQTFLISLYVPEITGYFGLSNSYFGSIYGAATIVSAFFLLYAGNLIDTWDLKKYTALSVILLSVSCIIMSAAYNRIFLFIGMWGLRFSGQGLFTHISSTSISRHFTSGRGKALSVSSLGYSLGEGILPVIVSSVIITAGWRISMLGGGVLTGLVLLPLILFLLGGSRFSDLDSHESSSKKSDFDRRKLFKDKRFYIISYNTFVLSFAVTGLFFYQVLLAEEKGWSIEWMAFCFIGYALGRAAFSLLSGPLIDSLTALKLFPYYLLPFAAGIAAVAFFSHYLIAPFYLVLTGMSVGMSGTVKTAVMAEAFGTRNIGGIRSVFAMISVLSTAISPALFGFILDSGIGFRLILILCMAAVFVSVVTGFFMDNRRIRK